MKKAKEEFDASRSDYISMILNVLKEFYSDEYAMLVHLALGNSEDFMKYAMKSPNYTNHLKGYGIVHQSNNTFDFKIDAIKKFLETENRYSKINLTPNEKLAEISERRNIIEPKLRSLVRKYLKGRHGEMKAKEIVLGIMGAERSKKFSILSYDELFDSNKCNFYFDDLRKIISKEWQTYENIFSKDKRSFELRLELLNKIGRSDAHAKAVTEEEMSLFRHSMSWLEDRIEEFL